MAQKMKIKVFSGEMAIVDKDDYEWLRKMKWYLHTGYPATKIKGKAIFMHRLINHTPDGLFTDHINRSPLDNRRENLRTADKKTNGTNRGAQINNSCGHKNVCYHKASKLWTVGVSFDGKRVVKYFREKEDAVKQSEEIRKDVYGFQM